MYQSPYLIEGNNVLIVPVPGLQLHMNSSNLVPVAHDVLPSIKVDVYRDAYIVSWGMLVDQVGGLMYLVELARIVR